MRTTCTHCDRLIIMDDGVWIDPLATGDDSIWGETCNAHDSMFAEHEPSLAVVKEQAANETLAYAQTLALRQYNGGKLSPLEQGILDHAMEKHGPEGVYADGEIFAEDWR